jgi:arylsulfatase A-like enzyme
MSNRPNILWYCTDQQRFDTIGALGNSHINTPRLDEFMRQSVTFTHAYCQSPICTPSRASFMTGMYPSAVSVTGNGNPVFPEYYEDRLITHALAQDGYDCGLIGKLHLASAFEAQEHRVNDGYRYFQYSHDHGKPNALGHEYADWQRARGVDPEALIAGKAISQRYPNRSGRVQPPTPDRDNVPPHLHQTYWCTEKTIEFIEKNRRENQPWLLSLEDVCGSSVSQAVITSHHPELIDHLGSENGVLFRSEASGVITTHRPDVGGVESAGLKLSEYIARGWYE